MFTIQLISIEASMSIEHMVESFIKMFWFFNWAKKIRFNHFTIRQNRVMDKVFILDG